jgi:macrolide transport system ATP-binding/permease protein
MRLWSRVRSWLRAVARRARMESEMDAELRFHIEAFAEDLERKGVLREEALRLARIEFGGIERAKEECREARGITFLETLFQDLRYGLRMLRKNPAFTAVAVGTLALGIAVNTAVFSAFDALVLRPRPVKDPESLVAVFRTAPGDARGRFSYPDYVYFRDHSKSFSDLSLFAFGMALTSSDLPPAGPEARSRLAGAVGFQLPQLLQGSAQPIGCFFVSGNYFQMLGAVPLRGRLLLPEDDLLSSSPVAVLSGNFWQRQFHSDPKIVGSILHLNAVAFTIVGVTPVDYMGTLPNVPSLWAPVAAKVQIGGLSAQDLENPLMIAGMPMGRLGPGVSLSDAQAELDVLAAQLRAAHPKEERDKGVVLLPDRNAASMFEPGDWAIIAAVISAVGLLLLIACANVASLLLARAAVRHKEIAVRLAIGASRRRLLQQLLTESLLIALFAGAIGLPLAGWLLHLLIVEIASALPSAWGTIALQVSPDVRIFTYALLVSCAAGIAFGLAPALQASRPDVNSALKAEGTPFGRRLSRSRLRGLLIASQMAACLVLLISSALLLRGSQRALKIDAGYESRHVLCLEIINPANLHYPQARMLQVNRDLIRGIAGVPRVRSVAQASRDPVGGLRWVPVAPVGAAASASANQESQTTGAGYSYVTPNYFETLSIPILRGRVFTPTEAEGQAPVVVISEATARRFWPKENPIGKHLKIGLEKGTMFFPGEKNPFIPNSEVIGIASDVRSMDLRRIDESYVYLPLSQSRQWTYTLLVRTEPDPQQLLPAFGREVQRVDANLPVVGAPLYTMISMDPFFVVSRVGGLLASIVGTLGLLLACMGVYGMVSYTVAQRTHEIGVRMALGAHSGQVLQLVVREGFRPILTGMVVGVLLSAGVSRLMAAILFGLSPLDVVSFLGVSVLLGGIALVATVLPARRAMRVDPMVALRYE